MFTESQASARGSGMFNGGEEDGGESTLSRESVSPAAKVSEATVLRNMTRRSGRRDEESVENRSLSLAGEGRLLQLESENASLAAEVEVLREALARLQNVQRSRSRSLSEVHRRSSRQLVRRRRHLLRDSILHTVDEQPETPGGVTIRVSRDKMSRNASIGTAGVLRGLPRTLSTCSTMSRENDTALLAERLIEVFREPLHEEHTTYLCSSQFADDLVGVAEVVSKRFEVEPRLVRIESPCYVFGDVHGNLEDLHFFSDHIWRLGVPLVAGHLLFLGDYVDRGLSSLEVVAYLFALKVRQPKKVWMLRGNHETRDVNGWKEHYGDRSFLWQCEHRFGEERGGEVWEAVNSAFDRLPLAALLDDEIFCVHGGIPRRPPSLEPNKTRLDLIDAIPNAVAINPPEPHISLDLQRVASECIWSDPALEEQESILDDRGFGDSMRGGGTVCFGNKAIQAFLKETGCSFIMRAHEAHAYGVSLSKMATVFTIFSTSKDHHQGAFLLCPEMLPSVSLIGPSRAGRMARAGCVLVDIEAIQVINRSPHYKNKFVHRRDSVSLDGLAPEEINRRAALGLVIPGDDDPECFYYNDEAYLEEDDDEDFFDQDDTAAFSSSEDIPFAPPIARLVDANYSFMPDDM